MQHSEAFQRFTMLSYEIGRMRAAIELGNRSVLDRCKHHLATPLRVMTKDDVYTLLREQDVRCPICLVSLELTKWCIDYDRETNLVRGLICITCNAKLMDWEEKIPRAAAHLSGTTRRVFDAEV